MGMIRGSQLAAHITSSGGLWVGSRRVYAMAIFMKLTTALTMNALPVASGREYTRLYSSEGFLSLNFRTRASLIFPSGIKRATHTPVIMDSVTFRKQKIMKGGVLAFGFKHTIVVDTIPIATDMITDTITSIQRLFFLLGFIYTYCRVGHS